MDRNRQPSATQHRTTDSAGESRLYQRVFEQNPDGMLIIEGHRFVVCNRAAAELLGYEDVGQLLGRTPEEISPVCQPDGHSSAKRSREVVAQARARGSQRFEWQHLKADGSPIWVEVLLTGLDRDERSKILVVWRDISRRKALEAEARAAQASLEAIIEHSPVGLLFLDGERRILHCNPAFLRMTGYRAEEVLGRTTAFLYTSHTDYEATGEAVYPVLRQGRTSEIEREFVRADGEVITVSLLGRPLDPCDLSQGFVWVLQDISERKALQDALEREATFDQLTGALNRRRIEQALAREMERSNRHGDALSVALLDVDHFKRVNDQYGHNVGDRVLQTLIRRCKENLRAVDLIGRWGGEEFLIVLPDTDRHSALQLAERLRARIAERARADTHGVTVSLGLASFRPGEGLDQLVKRADDALYRAKDRGRNRVEGEQPED
ncbi:diguanylate cyclase [Alkalilimnicola ehrlichii MLHE-1]|uniref:Diguanylate cyclase n=1 Tax=Alkalilimnicola ehrlichii (strain ATCC BAA-1101 / DSM 17681 / MLHE-1) TaxID=187272 RepID=Q0ACB8_ALKEH|nr:diguanylate cyclase [Alkalilimnicola ehrlichii]ABI55519.1 diguanylate cyclase [Alkalilimnicola ehrlichii MLHE-1]